MNEKARQAAITAVYDKLHENKLGAHWLWCVIEKIAAGQSEEYAMREYGYYSRALAAPTAPAPTEPPLRAELLCLCGCEWQWENRKWELVATPPSAAAQPEAVGAAIPLTPFEMQSNSSRVNWAEGLIRQLPEDHDGRNSWLLNYGGAPRPKDYAALAAQPGAVPAKNNDVDQLLRAVFELCEATEEAPEVEPKNEHQRGFDKGRRFEAKAIRRSVGDWFQATFCGQSFMGEPVFATPPSAATPEPSDAERYRYLRDFYSPPSDEPWDNMDCALAHGGEELDALIDAAIRATKGGEL